MNSNYNNYFKYIKTTFKVSPYLTFNVAIAKIWLITQLRLVSKRVVIIYINKIKYVLDTYNSALHTM